MATSELALAVDRAASLAQTIWALASEDRPKQSPLEVEKLARRPRAVRDAVPSVGAATRREAAPRKPSDIAVEPRVPTWSGPTSPVWAIGEPADAGRPLISVVRGPLPSLTEALEWTDTGERWVHLAEHRNRQARNALSHRSSADIRTKQQPDLVLWAVRALAFIVAVVVILTVGR